MSLPFLLPLLVCTFWACSLCALTCCCSNKGNWREDDAEQGVSSFWMGFGGRSLDTFMTIYRRCFTESVVERFMGKLKEKNDVFVLPSFSCCSFGFLIVYVAWSAWAHSDDSSRLLEVLIFITRGDGDWITIGLIACVGNIGWSYSIPRNRHSQTSGWVKNIHICSVFAVPLEQRWPAVLKCCSDDQWVISRWVVIEREVEICTEITRILNYPNMGWQSMVFLVSTPFGVWFFQWGRENILD